MPAILLGFDVQSAGSIGIIGGADGPTAIFVTSKLKPELLGPIAVAAYSYMALVPIIQPPRIGRGGWAYCSACLADRLLTLNRKRGTAVVVLLFSSKNAFAIKDV